MDQQLNQNGIELRDRLAAARSQLAGSGSGQRINVAGVGRMVSTAYEQLRNAAEYTQEHLLRQRAIRRFFIRNLPFHTRKDVDANLADELIIELTQAGYIANNSLPVSATEQLAAAAQRHYDNFWRMREVGVKYDYAHNLALDLLSVESDTLIGGDERQAAFTMFAYRHYLTVLNKDDYYSSDAKPGSYETSLYVAVHKALRKSDLAAIRYDMQRLQQASDADIHAYVQFYVMVDGIFYSDTNDRLTRHINRYGAPLRVLKRMAEESPDTDALLADKSRFISTYESYIKHSYEEAGERLNKGVLKSIIFLLITKALVGLAVEIPYDLLIAGTVALTPLVINLLSPIVLMILLRAGLRLPGEANTSAIRLYAEDMLYGGGSGPGRELYAKPRKKRYNIGFTIAYVLMFFLVFGAVLGQLFAWHFNPVQAGIFFIFLATASFLGFRLSRIVRELELVSTRAGAVTAIRDLFYLPFILLGQWLSDKYARVNIIALILDSVIELPLKTILRLVRQWTDFLSEKKEEI